ncbi:hypothetical protein KXX06_004266 [Aspergillus fumigatus]|nr:hypothetical protein KXX06_004266 [Aspergillus fumigatus]
MRAAAENGYEDVIRILVANGGDVNAGCDEDEGNALQAAAMKDPNTKGGMYGFALQAAVEEGHENIIQMLLDNGADVNLEGGPNGNAFQAAVENSDQDIVELLLAHGANINMMIGGEKYTALQEVARRGLEPMTALHQAAKEGQAGVVALLLRKGANPNIRDQRGFTALDWAKKKFTEVVRVLEAARQR